MQASKRRVSCSRWWDAFQPDSSGDQQPHGDEDADDQAETSGGTSGWIHSGPLARSMVACLSACRARAFETMA